MTLFPVHLRRIMNDPRTKATSAPATSTPVPPAAPQLRAVYRSTRRSRFHTMSARNHTTHTHMHAGTNAAYAEKIANIPSMQGAGAAEDAETVVNTEWGAFDCLAIPRCAADAALDAASVRPGTQLFEKLVSGMYIPEIVRRCAPVRVSYRLTLRHVQCPCILVFSQSRMTV